MVVFHGLFVLVCSTKRGGVTKYRKNNNNSNIALVAWINFCVKLWPYRDAETYFGATHNPKSKGGNGP